MNNLLLIVLRPQQQTPGRSCIWTAKTSAGSDFGRDFGRVKSFSVHCADFNDTPVHTRTDTDSFLIFQRCVDKVDDQRVKLDVKPSGKLRKRPVTRPVALVGPPAVKLFFKDRTVKTAKDLVLFIVILIIRQEEGEY